MGKKRLSDFEHYHVEEIVLDESHSIWFHQVNIPSKKIKPFSKELLHNIQNNQEYYEITWQNIVQEYIEVWDIIELRFVKDFKNKQWQIVLRFLIQMKYSTSVNGCIYIFDEETWFSSKARFEKLITPIYIWWKRRIELKQSLEEALVISVSKYLHEKRIVESKIYKKWEKPFKWWKWFFSSKIWSIFKK